VNKYDSLANTNQVHVWTLCARSYATTGVKHKV